MRGLIAASLLVVAGACSPSASPSPTIGPLAPSPSVETTFGPSPSPAQSASATASAGPSATPAIGALDVLPPGAAVQVAVKDLNVRKNPTTSARRITTVSRGDVLVISPNDNSLFGFGPGILVQNSASQDTVAIWMSQLLLPRSPALVNVELPRGCLNTKATFTPGVDKLTVEIKFR